MAETKFVKMRFKSADELRAICNAYFAHIDTLPPHNVMIGKTMHTRYVPYTPAGLARALGITTQTLGKYLRGEVEFPETISAKMASEVMCVLTDARMKIEDDITTKALLGEIDNTVAKQVMGMLGYNKSMDEAGEEANNTVRVIVQGASKSEIESWSK